jgi:hypothetical protein
MALTALKPEGYAIGLSRPGANALPIFADSFKKNESDDESSSTKTRSAGAVEAGDAGGYNICLECALPLRSTDPGRTLQCQCPQYEEVESDWLDVGGYEIAIAICVGLACLIVCLGAWH